MNDTNLNTDLKNSFKSNINIEQSIGFLNYLELFLANTATKRVQGYGTVGLAHNTVRTYRSLQRIIKTFEKDSGLHLKLCSFDKNMAEDLTRYLKLDKQYSDNYTGQILKLLKVVLRDAQKSGHTIHPYSNYIEVFKQKKAERIIHILSVDEIKKIKSLRGISAKIKDSYNWLLIGLCMGQRVSDLMSLTQDNIRLAPRGLYVDIIQQKTKTGVTVGVSDPLVINIIKNEFPKRLSQVVFNRDIKLICKLAGINQLVKGFKNNPKRRRKELAIAPKFEFVTSHTMRRSFASNYFGKIETPLLMNITGHSKESNFLTYIGTHQNKDALADLFMKQSGVIW
jgi:integrase